MNITQRRWFKLLVLLSRFGLAAMFLFAAGAKLYTVRDFAGNVANLVGTSWAWPATVFVITAELTTALLLIAPRTVRLGAALAALLLVGFAAYALFYVYVQHGEPLECGCFGKLIASQLGVSTAKRNLLLLVPTLIVLFGYRQRERLP
ncbi:MAG TPA: MauE/DoxX family redox-associated membrane protein [Pyrinomonadaceae bacterium]|nr:MauE/DoxX family redox-associated membrane protein [Pyrinomonadaceae bacterium]